MNKKQMSYFNMAKAVCDVFANNPVWKGEEMVKKSVDKVNELCRGIDQEAAKQQRNQTEGFTEDKERERTLLEDRLSHITACLKVYARNHSKGELAAMVKHSPSQLDRMPLLRLLALARSVADAAASLDVELEPYKISQAEIGELRLSISTTEQLNAHRDALVGEHSENTAHLQRLFDGLRDELEALDSQVEAFIADEEFRQTYFFNRRIRDARGKKAKETASPQPSPARSA